MRRWPLRPLPGFQSREAGRRSPPTAYGGQASAWPPRPLETRPASSTLGGVLLFHRHATGQPPKSTRWLPRAGGPSSASHRQPLSFGRSCHRRSRGPPQKPPGRHRRALVLLASCPDGCTEAVMQAHGFTIEQIAELITRWARHPRSHAGEDHGGGAARAGGLGVTGHDYLGTPPGGPRLREAS